MTGRRWYRPVFGPKLPFSDLIAVKMGEKLSIFCNLELK